MKLVKPFNNYNLFFILERALLIHSKTGDVGTGNRPPSPTPQAEGITGYECIDPPPLPPRYRHLKSSLAQNWYDPGRKALSKRKHTKSHGVATFREIAKTVASNWRAIDPVTRKYVDAVALLIKRRHKELREENSDAGALVAKRRQEEFREQLAEWTASKGASTIPQCTGNMQQPFNFLEVKCIEEEQRKQIPSFVPSSSLRANTPPCSNAVDYISPELREQLAELITSFGVSTMPTNVEPSAGSQPMGNGMSFVGKLCDKAVMSDEDILNIYHSEE